MIDKKNAKSGVPQFQSTLFNTAPDQVLGAGYSNDMQMPAFPCVVPTNIVYSGGSQSLILFSNSVTFDQFTNELIEQKSKSENFIIFSHDSTSTYIQYVQNSSYTQSFYFLETITFPTTIFEVQSSGTDILTPFGKSVYAMGPNIFRAVCGDQFVAQEALGAGLYAAMKLNFYSVAAKATFNSYINIGFLSILDAYAAIQATVSAYNLDGFMEFLIYQAGGNAAELGQILSANPTTCSFSSLSDCQAIINSVLNYANSNFPTQVGFSNGQIYGNAIQRGFVYANYTQYGLDVGESIVTSEIEEARQNLASTYSMMQNTLALVNKVVNSAISQYLQPVAESVFSYFVEAVNYNMNLLNSPINGAMGCYSSPTSCLNITANYYNQSMPLNYTLVNGTLAQFETGYEMTVIVSGTEGFTLQAPMLPIGDNLFFPNIISPAPLTPQIILPIEGSDSLELYSSSGSLIASNSIYYITTQYTETILSLIEEGSWSASFECGCSWVNDLVSPCGAITNCEVELTAIPSGVF
jgi:hypothetical protein